jgi:hypothetical protein
MIAHGKFKTLFALGLDNAVRVTFYRLRLRFGIHPVQWISAIVPTGPFFRMLATACHADLSANDQWNAKHVFFGWFSAPSTAIPDWFTNPFSGKRFPAVDHPWWKIPDFDAEVGDIKTIWEASRFEWVIGFAQQASQGDTAALDRLNRWLQDWTIKNPPCCGPNWKCGQEASIRVMHLAMAALILQQTEPPEPGLVALVKMHLQRIAPTISYAIAQDNNHGTSEVAALFIGGSWLGKVGDPEGSKWARLGRKWLKNRAIHLIGNDGSFSQYSVNYHRVMLDTYCMTEVWRQKLNQPPFSKRLYDRLSKAANWLYQFTDPETGDTPNMGANDGARLLPLADTVCRDFRPTVQLSMTLFNHCRAYEPDGAWNLPLHWLGILLPHALAKPHESRHFNDGGYCILRNALAFGVIRFARFQFRPSHADCLHIDLWHKGRNILRDGGTFSYNTEPRWLDYFSGTESHNTVQFDSRNQMPRIGRFLFGNWLKMSECTAILLEASRLSWTGAYVDGHGASHRRTVNVQGNSWRVVDEIHGYRDRAILRWRLIPELWSLENRTCDCSLASLEIVTCAPLERIELVTGWESLHYQEKTELPVLEVEVGPGQWTIETEIVLKD